MEISDIVLSQLAENLENEFNELNDSAENLILSQVELGEESLDVVTDIFSDVSFDVGLDLFEFQDEKPPEVPPEVDYGDTAWSSDAMSADKTDLVKTMNPTAKDSERFRKPVTDDEIEIMKASVKNKNTAKNTKWAVNIFEEWREKRNDQDALIQEIHLMDKPTLAFWLTRFFMEVRNQKGDDYPPKSLYMILCGLLRNLRDNNVHDKNFLDANDPEFAELIVIIDSRMKVLLSNGCGTKTLQADPISPSDEDTLWQKGIFGSADAQTLQHTMFFYCCKLFGMRGRDEHRNLICEQFSLGEDRNGRYIRFVGRDSKTYKGGLGQMSIQNKDIKRYCSEGPRCLATFFEQYLGSLGNSGPFYRRPLSGSILKYSRQPVGINKLANFMKDICLKGDLKGNYTNHSGKQTCATNLYNSGTDEQSIMDRMGHRSENAVRKYKRCSDELRKQVSFVLDPVQPKKFKAQTATESVASDPSNIHDVIDKTVQEAPNTTMKRSSLADLTSTSGVINFSGCTFNF